MPASRLVVAAGSAGRADVGVDAGHTLLREVDEQLCPDLGILAVAQGASRSETPGLAGMPPLPPR